MTLLEEHCALNPKVSPFKALESRSVSRPALQANGFVDIDADHDKNENDQASAWKIK